MIPPAVTFPCQRIRKTQIKDKTEKFFLPFVSGIQVKCFKINLNFFFPLVNIVMMTTFLLVYSSSVLPSSATFIILGNCVQCEHPRQKIFIICKIEVHKP